jgi:hypothetical protein
MDMAKIGLFGDFYNEIRASCQKVGTGFWLPTMRQQKLKAGSLIQI